MKLILKFGVITGLFLSCLITMNCRTKPSPVTDIGLSCQRLSNCFVNYGSQLKDPAVKKLVDDAQTSRDENKCIAAIQQFSTSVNQECPF